MALWSTGAIFLRESGLPVATFMTLGNVVGLAAILAPAPRAILLEAAEAAAASRGPLAVLALAGALNAGTYFLGMSIAPIVDVMAGHYVGPVLVALAAPLLVGDRPTGRTWAAIALACAGVAAILRAAGGEGAVSAAGVGLGLLSACGFAAAVLSIRALGTRRVPARVVSAVLAAGLLPFVAPLFDAGAVTFRGAALAALAGVLHLPVAAVLFARGTARTPAPAAGMLGYTELAFGAFWGAILYAEPLTPARVAGVLLIVAGGALILTERTARPIPVPPAVAVS